jgi:hypothetical protein
MEEVFKGELAVIWGVEDEDDLPDNLQVCGIVHSPERTLWVAWEATKHLCTLHIA